MEESKVKDLTAYKNRFEEDASSFSEFQARDFVKELKNQGYFEDLIQRYLLDNPHGSVLTLNPSRGLTARKAKALEDKYQHR